MQQSFGSFMGTFLAIGGIAWSISVFVRIAVVALDRHHRWF